MDTLPIIAGLITVVSALILLFSIIAYRRTGLRRMLSITGLALILMIKGIMLFLDIAGMQRFTYELWAGLDLLMVVFLALMLFGKE